MNSVKLHNINIQKSVIFLYTINEHSKNEIKKTIQFVTASYIYIYIYIYICTQLLRNKLNQESSLKTTKHTERDLSNKERPQ